MRSQARRKARRQARRAGSRHAARCTAAFGAALALSAAASPPAGAADDLTRGYDTYRSLCATCHGPLGAGDGPEGASLGQRPADLRRIAERRDGRFDRREVAAIIDGRGIGQLHRPREMPVWGELGLRARPASLGGDATGSMEPLLAWLESIQIRPGTR